MTSTENNTNGHSNSNSNSNGAEPEAPAAPQISPAEVTEALDEAVRKAVGTRIAAQAREIATGVVARMLTPEVLEGMREAAEREVTATLDRDTTATAGEAGTAAGDSDTPTDGESQNEGEAEPEREMEFPTVAAFVEGYISQLYRREISSMGSERQRRWCPQWWLHGEAVARFDAMWTAFEHLRLGDGEEMSTVWLNHIDPHMAILLSPDGPFKYCTNGGHSTRLVALPTATAPAATAPNGHYEQDASSLWRPSGAPSKARTVLAWPE
ncbi:DUF4913 domain-containing protein [Nocardia carnea]|uniref:DUF4913 domain-containing protein n=1 Tax=Nocardia carnea TaxID=37328 RepID=UPI002455C4B7|nr:DUF4913 domain-containing protein [Nocardia carnea]